MKRREIGETLEVPSSPCWHCGVVMDRCSAVGDVAAKPKPGDITVCIKCATINVYGSKLQLHKPTIDMLNAMGPEVARYVHITQKAIAVVRRAKRK